MNTSHEHAVDARDLAFAYRDRPALDGVSFAVHKGEVFGFLGPNGSGKTTLFRILATLLRPDRGRLTVLEHSFPDEASAIRRRLGVVFQAPSLDRELTVGENLGCHGRLYGLSRRQIGERSAELLDRFGLADRAGDRVAALSGGLARRVEIAKALLPRPELLLLDEPSTGLDPGARRDLADRLATLAGDGVTVLLTTHFMEEAERCHRLALTSRGRIVAEGTPAELKAEVGGDVVTLETEDADALRRDLEERFSISAEIVEGRVRFEHDSAHALLASLAEAFPGRIRSMTVARPTLEDVFLKHTGHGLSQDEMDGLGEREGVA